MARVYAVSPAFKTRRTQTQRCLIRMAPRPGEASVCAEDPITAPRDRTGLPSESRQIAQRSARVDDAPFELSDAIAIEVLNYELHRTLRNRGEYIRPIELVAQRLAPRTWPQQPPARVTPKPPTGCPGAAPQRPNTHRTRPPQFANPTGESSGISRRISPLETTAWTAPERAKPRMSAQRISQNIPKAKLRASPSSARTSTATGTRPSLTIRRWDAARPA